MDVFCFMRNAHTLLIVTEYGEKIIDKEFSDAGTAKEYSASIDASQKIAETVGSSGFKLLWEDDPADNDKLISACKTMEEKGGNKEKLPENDGDRFEIPDPDENGIISISSIVQLSYEVRDESMSFSECAIVNINPGDTVRIVEDGYLVSSHLFEFCGINQTEYENIQFLTFREIPEEPFCSNETEGQENSEPKFDDKKSEIIEVECEITPSHKQLIDEIQKLRNLEAEANASAASYREDIKAQKKVVFDMSQGKSYTSMKCDIVNEWEAGIRNYVDPKTGLIMKTEQISDEERQLNFNDKLEPENIESSGEIDCDQDDQCEEPEDLQVENSNTEPECDPEDPVIEEDKPSDDEFGEPPE